MRFQKFIRSGLLVFLAGAFATSALADDRAEIRKQMDTEMAGVREHDIEKVMSVYAPNAQLVVFDAVPPPKFVGWDAVRQDYLNYFSAFPGPIEGGYYDEQIGSVGDLGYTFAFQKWIFTKADGTKVPFFQRVSQVYRKINGRWLMIHEHASVPIDLFGDGDNAAGKSAAH